VVLLAGCGDGSSQEPERFEQEVRERTAEVRERTAEVRSEARRLRDRARRARARIRARVERILDDLEKSVPRAGPTTRAPSAEGQTERTTIDDFLTTVIKSVDAYWTQTLSASGQPEPNVAYTWVKPGRPVRSACGAVADDRAAFYCPADDTIYVAQVLASQLYQGVAEGFPGQQAGYGRAVGDFGVAYIVAHEYAHNLQQELGFFRTGGRGRSTRPFELQADCMAGLWGNSVYRAGKLQPGDVEEAMDTALAVGDFDYGNEQHHGTPEERRDAWLLGFRRGDPSACARLVTDV
jgi:predicted metalloprotease